MKDFYRVMLGRGSMYAQECREQGYIGAGFDINQDLSNSLPEDWKEFNKEFKVDIKQYVQAIINKDIENTGLILSPRFFINSSERIVFNGKNTNNKFAPRLVVTYTTY